MVLGDWSVSTPPLAVAPSSFFRAVNVTRALCVAGVLTCALPIPAPMSAALTSWPAVTGLALLVRVPAAGRVVIFTAARALRSEERRVGKERRAGAEA